MTRGEAKRRDKLKLEQEGKPDQIEIDMANKDISGFGKFKNIIKNVITPLLFEATYLDFKKYNVNYACEGKGLDFIKYHLAI